MTDAVQPKAPEDASIATLAGGCFWCIEQAFEKQPGVYDALTGYIGGLEEDANYQRVCSGTSGHREAVQIYFDPEVISYAEILEIFWRQIDPTDVGGQFADRGEQYKTAIYVHDEEQRKVAEASKAALGASGKFKEPVVTEIKALEPFYFAEEAHQNYAQKRAAHYQMYKIGSGRAGFIEENWGA